MNDSKWKIEKKKQMLRENRWNVCVGKKWVFDSELICTLILNVRLKICQQCVHCEHFTRTAKMTNHNGRKKTWNMSANDENIFFSLDAIQW